MVKLAMHFAQGSGSACSVAIHRPGKKKAAGWHAGGRLEQVYVVQTVSGRTGTASSWRNPDRKSPTDRRLALKERPFPATSA